MKNTCERCNKHLRLSERCWRDTKEKERKLFCPNCAKIIEEEKTIFEDDKEKQFSYEQKQLSIPELQLQEIRKMRKDVATIKDIMVFYFILFLISLVLVVISALIMFR